MCTSAEFTHTLWVKGCASALDTAVWECPEFGEQPAHKLFHTITKHSCSVFTFYLLSCFLSCLLILLGLLSFSHHPQFSSSTFPNTWSSCEPCTMGGAAVRRPAPRLGQLNILETSCHPAWGLEGLPWQDGQRSHPLNLTFCG